MLSLARFLVNERFNRLYSCSRLPEGKFKKLPKKVQVKIESQNQILQATKQQGDGVANSGNSKSKLFKSYPIDPKIIKFIDDNLLGKRRYARSRRSDRGMPDLSHVSRCETDAFFNARLFSFVKSASKEEEYPPATVPEVCFIGRSNVGKSSIINSISNSQIVKTNKKPGFTQTLNWFSLYKSLNFVDLPGYGFAYANTKKMENWIECVKNYLTKRTTLKRCYVLLDSRQAMKKSDHELFRFLDANTVPYQIILTKTDLILPKDLARRWYEVKQATKNYKKIIYPIHIVSSVTKAGISHVRRDMVSMIVIERKDAICEILKKTEQQKMLQRKVKLQNLMQKHLQKQMLSKKIERRRQLRDRKRIFGFRKKKQ